MELNYLEQLELGNSIEHLKVVRSNLRIASEELSKTLNLTTEAKQQLAEVLRFDETIKATSLKVSQETLEQKIKQDNRELRLFEREVIADGKDKENEAKETALFKKLEEVKRETVAINTSNEKLTQDCNSLMVEISSDIQELKTIKNETEKENTSKLLEKKNLENEIARLESEREEVEKGLTSFNLKANQEMESITETIALEKEKTDNPRKSLLLLSDALDKKERNLNILASRIRKQFQKLDANAPLPLELKQDE